MRELTNELKHKFLNTFKDIIINDTFDDLSLFEIYDFNENRYIKLSENEIVEQERKPFEWFVEEIISRMNDDFNRFTIFHEIDEDVELDFDDESILSFINMEEVKNMAKEISEETWKVE